VEVFHQGAVRSVLYMPGTRETFDAACKLVPGNKVACPAQLIRLIQRLADHGRLRSGDQFVHEGDQIYAIKTRCGLRAYGWFDTFNGQAVFVVSHYMLKKRQRLDPADIAIVERNRTAFRTEAT
jgi:hypothetical protein